jgi:hypothetical protein
MPSAVRTIIMPSIETPDHPWPALPYDAWKDTYVTLHLWAQIVGKVALAQAPALNHSWAVALHVTSRGLQTATLPHGPRSFSIAFDFIDHQLEIRASEGAQRVLPLAPRSVAEFYGELMAAMRAMDLPVRIWSMPVEVPSPIRFEQDTVHSAYDPHFAHRFWRIVVQAHRIFTACRSVFVGKCSPVHFFWGSFDLAVTRFSGRRAPPREGPAFMRDAYSHEVISHGFGPGGASVLEPAFYAYAAPEPSGLKTARVAPDAAYYHHGLNEFILPYEAVRTADAPDATLMAFVESTYEAAATLAGWDRTAIETRVSFDAPAPESQGVVTERTTSKSGEPGVRSV